MRSIVEVEDVMIWARSQQREVLDRNVRCRELNTEVSAMRGLEHVVLVITHP